MSRAQSPDVGRRRFLAGAVTAGAGALLGRRLAAAERASAAALPLITRAIPSSGERLPAIGIGTDSFSESAREAIRAELARLASLGATVIDTAAAYGDSEALIGDALANLGARDGMFIATKLVGGGIGVTGAESLAR